MVTIKDVAKRSGFSVATVSAVVNDVPVVSAKTREQIYKAIKELGYHPNAIARSLKRSKTSTIGIIVRDITNSFYSEVIYGLEEEVWSNNYEVFLCNTENSMMREHRYIDNLIEKRVDGIIITTPTLERTSYYEKLQEQGIPYIFLNRYPNELLENEWYVGADNRLSAQNVVDYLVQLGYRNIAHLGGPQGLSTFRDRLLGFQDGMAKNRLEIKEEWLLISEYSRKDGYEQMKALIEKGRLPEVIFCSADPLAFGVFDACKEKGIRIPEEIALISIDNNQFGDLIDLSSVDLQNKEMGRTAGKLLVNLLNDKPVETEGRQILLDSRIITRKSCGGPLRSGGK